VNAQPKSKPTPAPKGLPMSQYGTVNWVTAYSSSDGKACIASVAIQVSPGSNWFVSAADQSICDLFGKAKEGDKRIFMLGERMPVAYEIVYNYLSQSSYNFHSTAHLAFVSTTAKLQAQIRHNIC
jgi:hypothetical protein